MPIKTCQRLLRIALIIMLVLLFALPALAGFYEVYHLSWWTAHGGGGTSSGGGYTLSGTSGQPNAGALSGEGYTLVGGFWGGGVVQYHFYLPMVLRNYTDSR